MYLLWKYSNQKLSVCFPNKWCQEAKIGDNRSKYLSNILLKKKKTMEKQINGDSNKTIKKNFNRCEEHKLS